MKSLTFNIKTMSLTCSLCKKPVTYYRNLVTFLLWSVLIKKSLNTNRKTKSITSPLFDTLFQKKQHNREIIKTTTTLKVPHDMFLSFQKK